MKEQVTKKIEYFDKKVRQAQSSLKTENYHTTRKLIIRWSAKREALRWVLTLLK